jgi:hypothetical protein
MQPKSMGLYSTLIESRVLKGAMTVLLHFERDHTWIIVSRPFTINLSTFRGQWPSSKGN